MISLSRVDRISQQEYCTSMKCFAGVNKSCYQGLVPLEESPDTQNADSSQGVLKRIGGFGRVKLLYGNTEKNLAQLPESVVGFFEMRGGNTEGFKNLYYSDNTGNLYKFEYSPLRDRIEAVEITSSANDGYNFTYFTQFKENSKNKAVVGSKNSGPFIFTENGTYILTPSANKPKMAKCAMHYSRLFGIGDPANPQRIWFSKINQPYNFDISDDGGGYIDITDNIGDTIDVISLFDTLYVFCRYGILAVNTLSVQSDFTVENAYYSDSEIIPGSICVIGKSILFSTRYGVFEFNGSSVVCVSEKIGNFFCENNIIVDSEHSILFSGKYFLTFHTEGCEMGGLLIYNTVNRQWQICSDLEISSMIVIRDNNKEKLLTSFGESCVIAQWDAGERWGNSGIVNAYWQSSKNDFGQITAKKRMTEVHFSASGSGSIKITLQGDEKDQSRTVLLSKEEKTFRLRFDVSGNLIGFRIENIDGADFCISPMTFIFSLERENAK